MKRWQDRGEVLDSDDEDLSLESGPSEQPRKKAKLSDDHGAAKDVYGLDPQPGLSGGIEDLDGDEWIQTKVARGATYSRKANIIRPGEATSVSVDSITQNRVVEVSRLSRDDQLAQSPKACQDAPGTSNRSERAPPVIQRQVDGELGKPSDMCHSKPITEGDVASPGNPTTPQRPSQSTHQPYKNEIPASQASRSLMIWSACGDSPKPEEHAGALSVPEAATLNSPPLLRVLIPELSTTSDGIRDLEHDSSGLSSPLSEREMSPPPGFRVPRFQPPAMPQQTLGAGPSPTDAASAALAAALQADASEPVVRRRELRARKDKQLHPYLFERAQYQEQWRSRGLQPVNFRVVEKADAGTQDSFSNGGNTSQGATSPPIRSSPARFGLVADDDSILREREGQEAEELPPQLPNSDEYLPDIDDILDRGRSHVQNHRKRRRLVHPKRAVRPLQQDHFSDHYRTATADDYDIPRFPPLTSSAFAKHHPAPHFQMPFGMTAVLPAPQVSSDVQARHHGGDGLSDPDTPPRSRLRASTRNQRQLETISVDSATESSESDAEPPSSTENLGLNREQRRIKGVLPASWLKIDLLAQKKQVPPSPSRNRRRSPSPPLSTIPTKGVAQRVTRRPSGAVQRTNALVVSDLDDSDESATATAASGLVQSRVHHTRESFIVAPSETLDDERMEMDFVDPMFTATSSRGNKGARRKKRQPRIDHLFDQSRNQGLDLSEERRGLSYKSGTIKSHGRSKSKSTKAGRSKALGRSAPRLSIADAPISPSSANVMPRFVRLALRQSRARPDRGRHSPTQKIIRLATKDDTDDASAMLSAWRGGRIAPRSSPQDLGQSVPALEDTIEVDDEFDTDSVQQRQPLRDITNSRQPPLSPLRNENTSGQLRTVSTTTVPRPRQTQLRPAVLQKPIANDEVVGGQQRTTPGSDRPRRRARTTRQAAQYRSAQLETLETTFDHDHRQAAFRRRINCLTEALRRTKWRESALPMQRFLEDGSPAAASLAQPPQHSDRGSTHPDKTGTSVPRPNWPRRPRKRQPQHVDADARQFRQPSEPLPDVVVFDEPPTPEVHQSGPVLKGLGPFGTFYPTNFDVHPLALDTYFHQTTFIGSGDFAASLSLAKRELNIPTGHLRVHIDGDVLEWGPWTDEVATGIARIPRAIAEGMQCLIELSEADRADSQLNVYANVDYMLRSVVRYCSKCLSFLDAVDRRLCIHQLEQFMRDLTELLDSTVSGDEHLVRLKARSWQFAVVIAKELSILCGDALVPTETKKDAQSILTKAARGLVRQVFPSGFAGLRSFYEDNRISSKREAGIRDDEYAVSSIVILHHSLGDGLPGQSAFWEALSEVLEVGLSTVDTVGALDKIWHNVFTTLPALEIDANGEAHPGSRMIKTQANWALIKRLLNRTFDLYPSTSSIRGSMINNYIRATLARCHRLLARWGWYECEAVLVTVFDFFARRKLAQLENEESRGSPRFLEQLDDDHALEVQPEDRALHIFLKMLATGLCAMRRHYSDKKMGGVSYRFIPNHGREYSKEAEVKQIDLDALRNHLDLLCTLYVSLPAGQRPRINLLQDLIDLSSSHRGACRLSVRSWSNATAFQSSTKEPVESLYTLMAWFQDIVQITLAQYRLAKSEAEQDFETAKAAGVSGITQETLSTTISSNQRQIAVTLVDALAGLKRAIVSANNILVATYMIQSSAYWSVFESFDPLERRLISALDEALEVTKTCLVIWDRFYPAIESQQTSEESQEYGDSCALQELVATETTGNGDIPSIPEILYEPVGRLVSDVFGADTDPDDRLLSNVVQIWIKLAEADVRTGSRTWASYIDDYSSSAWSQLRDTSQKRKFTSYFLACVVEKAGSAFGELRASIMTAWFASLFDREVMLKYQHVLTTALLNSHSNDSLLQNLPFGRALRGGRFDVTLQDLRQRRLALISSVMLNMRDDVDTSNGHAKQELRVTYGNMLLQVMRIMKDNYQELQTAVLGDVADHTIQGAYVDFVQHVVSLLQQYAVGPETERLCKIDPFFTESAAFPLPVADPLYVVGKLRHYGLKLQDDKKRKELATFVHTVCERAAVDNEQQYLANQLCTAVNGVVELGRPNSPSLRQVMLTAIFPTYLASALSTAASWILSLPLLQASAVIVQDLLYNLRAEEFGSVDAVTNTAEAIIEALHHPLQHALLHTNLLGMPHVQRVLTLAFEVGKSTVTLSDYIKRRTRRTPTLHSLLKLLRRYALEVEAHMTGQDYEEPLQSVPANLELTCHWPDTRNFVQRQAQESDGYWVARDGQYFMTRSMMTKEIVVDLGDKWEQREKLLGVLREFCMSYGAVIERRDVRQRTECVEEVV